MDKNRVALTGVGVVLMGLGLSFCLLLGRAARAEGLTIVSGVEARNGEYVILARPDARVLPISAQYETDRFTYLIRVSYVSPFPIARDTKLVKDLPNSSYQPFVDLVASDFVSAITYKAPDLLPGGWRADATAAATFNNTDARLGSVGVLRHYAVKLDLSKEIGALTLETGAGYRAHDALPGFSYRNAAFGYVGGSYRVDAHTSIELYSDFRQGERSASRNEMELSAFLSRELSDKFKLQAQAVRSSTRGGHDVGLGLLLSYSY
jgi:hypothetical protein